MKHLNKLKLTLLVFFGLVAFFSCSDEDDYTPVLPDVSIVNQGAESSSLQTLIQADTLYLKANVKSVAASTFYWSVNSVKQSEDSLFKFAVEEPGNYTISLTATNPDGETSASLEVDVYGKYKYGTFVLNEGNMTTENGTLIFISPKGIVTDSVYLKENGTEIGNSAQDLFIVNNKMYIISQNGKRNDKGDMLIVTNAETLKKEAVYNDELATLSWPTHIAVLGNEEIYIRDGKGIHHFNTSTKELNLIKGTSGALKNSMAVVGGKLFVPGNKSVLVIEQGKDSITYKIDMAATVSGVIKSSDGNIWVSTKASPSSISKISSSDYSVIKSNQVSEIQVGAGYGATPGISAIGDTLYFSNATTKIYRHIFSTETTEFMTNVKDHVENAGIVYNNLAVHPKTGEVYFTTIKNYGVSYLINDISVFDFSGSEPVLKADYKDYTNFPAGVFFTDSFN